MTEFSGQAAKSNAKTIILVLAGVSAGCCVLGGVALLGLGVYGASESVELETAVAPAAAPDLAAPVAGNESLVGFWDMGMEKYALFPDGTLKKWFRYTWNGSYGADTCKRWGDFTGTWSATENQLTVELTEGKWVSCRGDEEFTPSTEVFSYRKTFASGIGKTVLWLKDSRSEHGYNLECAQPSGCKFEPEPL